MALTRYRSSFLSRGALRSRLLIDSIRQDTLFEARVGRTVTLGANFRL